MRKCSAAARYVLQDVHICTFGPPGPSCELGRRDALQDRAMSRLRGQSYSTTATIPSGGPGRRARFAYSRFVHGHGSGCSNRGRGGMGNHGAAVCGRDDEAGRDVRLGDDGRSSAFASSRSYRRAFAASRHRLRWIPHRRPCTRRPSPTLRRPPRRGRHAPRRGRRTARRDRRHLAAERWWRQRRHCGGSKDADPA